MLWNPRVVVVALLASLCLASPATAARFHVHVGGSRANGPSTPGDWSLANCYGTLTGALTAAAAADSVLLFEESHTLNSAAILSSLLTNRQFATSPVGAEIVVGTAGTLTIDSALPATQVRGLAFVGTADPRIVTTLSVANPAGNVTSVTVQGCSFRGLRGGLQAGAGGSVLRALSPGNGAALEIADCTFTENQTHGGGGAIWIGGGYTVAVSDCAFTANHTTGGGLGGAMMVVAGTWPTSVTLEDCTFADNTAAGPGGTLNVDSASLVMRRCTMSGSRSAWEANAFWKEGAGLRVSRATDAHTDPVTVLIEDCEFRDNHGNDSANNDAGDGGAILVKGGDLTHKTWVEIDNCLFRGNSNAQGAGVYIGRFCEGEVRYCRFLDNIAWYQGGGAQKGGAQPECEGELATFAYCEFRGNRAGFRPDGTDTGEYSRGGGLLVRVNPRAHVYNCTFVDNRVNDAAYAIGDAFAHALEGGAWDPLNRCRLVNCAFWGTGGDIQVRSEGTGGMEQVANVAVAAGQMSVPGISPTGTVVLAGFPFVAPLDLRPAVGSPLIDAGIAVPYTVDLAGLAVPQGAGYDIGCYENHGVVGVGDLPPGHGRRLTVSPNPFNPRTTLTFTLDAPAEVALAIHDARGRLVREFPAGVVPAGSHAVTWDGRDDAGQDVAAGVYLACLRVGAKIVSPVKLSLVR